MNLGRRSLRWRHRWVAVLAPVLALVVVAGCSPEPQTEYTKETASNFFAGCTDPKVDSLLQTRLCQCVYQRMNVSIPYERLAVLDGELAADPELRLPREFVSLIAECVIEEGDLSR